MHPHVTKFPGLMLARGKISFIIALTVDTIPGIAIDTDGSLLFFSLLAPAIRIGCSHAVFRHCCTIGQQLYRDSGGFTGRLIIYNPLRPAESYGVAKDVFDYAVEHGNARLNHHLVARLQKRLRKLRQKCCDGSVDPELHPILVNNARRGLQTLLESSNDDIPPEQIAALLRLIDRPV